MDWRNYVPQFNKIGNTFAKVLSSFPGEYGGHQHFKEPIQNIIDNYGINGIDSGNTPLTLAIEMNEPVDVISDLITAGADVNTLCINGVPCKTKAPLFVAVAKKNTNIVKLLISAGADVNNIHHGRSILHEAVFRGNKDIVKLLIDAGANIDIRNSDLHTPLYHTIYHVYSDDDADIVKLLIDAGANVNDSPPSKWSLLNMIVNAKPELSNIMKLVLDAGAYVDEEAGAGMTPLFIAVLDRKPNAVKLLIDAGANVNRVCAGTTILERASKNLAHYGEPKDRSIIKMLINANASLSKTNVHTLEITHPEIYNEILTMYNAKQNQLKEQSKQKADTVGIVLQRQGVPKDLRRLMTYKPQYNEWCDAIDANNITPNQVFALAANLGIKVNNDMLWQNICDEIKTALQPSVMPVEVDEELERQKQEQNKRETNRKELRLAQEAQGWRELNDMVINHDYKAKFFGNQEDEHEDDEDNVVKL